MPKISACIVAYCDYDEVCAAVRSILHYTPAPDLALYVVDNGSPDGCGRQLAETDFGDSRVTVLPLSERMSASAEGHNAVLDRLTSEVHFILNPDIVLTERRAGGQWPRGCWHRPGAAMATPQLRYPDGQLAAPAPPQADALAAAGAAAGPEARRHALRRPTTTTRCRMRI